MLEQLDRHHAAEASYARRMAAFQIASELDGHEGTVLERPEEEGEQ